MLKPQYPDDMYVKAVCKVGQLECCRYLTMGPNGWSCEKGTPALKALLDDRVAKGTIRARGDNCEGLGSR